MVAVVLPVGQYVGRSVIGSASEPEDAYEVRVGAEIYPLTEEELAVWNAAMGTLELLEGGGHSTPLSITTLARNAGVADADTVFKELMSEGLLTQLVPTDNAMTRFAETYRVVPSALGLGADPNDPSRALLGIPDAPRVAVPLLDYQVWCFSSLHPSLWDTCQQAATVIGSPGEFTPIVLLRSFFRSLPSMLGVHCVYVDRRL